MMLLFLIYRFRSSKLCSLYPYFFRVTQLVCSCFLLFANWVYVLLFTCFSFFLFAVARSIFKGTIHTINLVTSALLLIGVYRVR